MQATHPVWGAHVPSRPSSLHWRMRPAGVLAFLLLTAAMLAQTHGSDVPCSKEGEFSITVAPRMALVLVSAEVDSKPVTLIVDTGSSNTILSTEPVKAAAAARPVPYVTKGSGLVSAARWTKATMKLGCIVWGDHRFLAMDDLSDISKAAWPES